MSSLSSMKEFLLLHFEISDVNIDLFTRMCHGKF